MKEIICFSSGCLHFKHNHCMDEIPSISIDNQGRCMSYAPNPRYTERNHKAMVKGKTPEDEQIKTKIFAPKPSKESKNGSK